MTPADGSGLVLCFDIRRARPAIVSLLGPSGKEVPPGHVGTITESGARVVVGFGGRIYIEDLSTPHTVDIEIEGIQCRYRILASPDSGADRLIRVGPLPCEESS